MEINPYIFRGYDIRGEVDRDLNPEVVELIGKAHGTYLKSIGVDKVVVGCDNRASSETYRQSVMKGLLSTGCHVIDLGLSLSPIVYWAQYHFESKGAVMITGSHNPVEYNGFKLGRDYSDSLTPIATIKELVQTQKFITGEGEFEVADPKYLKAYFEDLLGRVGKINPFKVVIDSSNATAGKFYPELLRLAGCDVIEQNCSLDSSFPNGTPDPTEEKVARRLAERVVKEDADLGFSFDSDGDRVGLVDDKGGFIWNDVLLAIFADDVISQKPGAKIVYNCLCSKIVNDVITKANGKPIMWMTGHAFIKDKVNSEKAPFGGELSGHFYFMDRFYGHDDGGYAALRILDYLSRKNQKLSDVVASFPKYISSPEIKIACPDETKFDVIAKITEDVKNDYPKAEFNEHSDPKQDFYIRANFPDGMIVMRPSQNGPYMTVKYEAQDAEAYEDRRQFVISELKKYPDIDWSNGVNLEQLQ